MEALVEVQRWLFSSLFCLALSLSFPPFLPFSSVLPELLSSQINSPPVFCSPSSVFCSSLKFCPPVRSSLSKKKSSPQVSFFPFSPPYLSSPFSVFIATGREGHLTTAMAQGKVAILPMSWHRVGWPVMACINGGRVWDVACVQVLWASGREKRRRR